MNWAYLVGLFFIIMVHFSSHSGSIIIKTVYGYDIDPSGDPFVDLGDRGMESVRRAANVGSFLVDYIPSLKYLPPGFLEPNL